MRSNARRVEAVCGEVWTSSTWRGMMSRKRAFQIAATGDHGLLMSGPPGSGKTMLASRMPSILPPLDESEMLETAVIHSVAGEDIDDILCGVRPFRHPHHSATIAGLVGGGNPLRPGEISLAHNGVLFLDELAEFKSSVLQSLRQPLESGRVVLTRADGSVSFPSRFLLVSATNPCPCGYLGIRSGSARARFPRFVNIRPESAVRWLIGFQFKSTCGASIRRTSSPQLVE